MTEIKPTTWQEAQALGGVWVCETREKHGWQLVLLGTVHEGEDDFAMDDEDPNWWCELHVISVLQGGPWPHKSLGGVKVENLRRPDASEQGRVVDDLDAEARRLEQEAFEVRFLCRLVELSEIDEED